MTTIDFILEPTGHIADKSKFERVWDQIPRGSSFRRRRVERFDARNMVAYSPLEYKIDSLEVIEPAIDDDGIIGDVVGFVRDEFGDRPSAYTRLPGPPRIVGRETGSTQLLIDYLSEVEEAFVYGGYLKGLHPEGGVGEFIHRVICDPRLGNPANKGNVQLDEFSRRVNATIASQERLCFVFPGFPFKDQNPTRTACSADHVDLADIGLLCQLHFQALCFFQQHPFGADFIILSDGHLYSDIFDVKSDEVDRYLARLRQWRNTLNLQGSVHIIDLEECIYRLPERELEAFDALKRRVNAMLVDERRVSSHPALKAAMEALVIGMRRNLNSRDILSSLPWEDQVAVIHGGTLSDDRARKVERQLSDRARSAAALYAATNVALRRHQVVDRVFQNSFRATIHPKLGQVGVPRSGSVYPWNGVGIVDKGARFPDRIRARQLGELGASGEEWIEGIMPGDAFPFYYRRA